MRKIAMVIAVVEFGDVAFYYYYYIAHDWQQMAQVVVVLVIEQYSIDLLNSYLCEYDSVDIKRYCCRQLLVV